MKLLTAMVKFSQGVLFTRPVCSVIIQIDHSRDSSRQKQDHPPIRTAITNNRYSKEVHMQIDTVLAPVDGTQEAIEAVEYAIAIAERYDACVHALYLLGEGAAAAIESNGVDPETVSERGEVIMEDVRELAGEIPIDHSSACGFSVSRLTQHPGSVILDVAEMLDVGFIVIPRQPVTGDSDAVIEKAAEYVLAYASQPVLSV